MPPRTQVREAAKTVLSRALTGLNARLAALATEANIDPQEIDWEDGSPSFLQVPVDPEGIKLSPQTNAAAVVNIKTGNLVNLGDQVGALFHLLIDLHVEIHLMFREEGTEKDDIIARTADAYEHAALQALWDDVSGLIGEGLSPQKTLTVPRSDAELLGDGWFQFIPIIIQVEVRVL